MFVLLHDLDLSEEHLFLGLTSEVHLLHGDHFLGAAIHGDEHGARGSAKTILCLPCPFFSCVSRERESRARLFKWPRMPAGDSKSTFFSPLSPQIP